ncbi:MAG: hypothetical protein OXG82_13555 [Gammaproteobacteria bacterium]|nr:hypothetical protein [Gammaproteobacteria bacterium]
MDAKTTRGAILAILAAVAASADHGPEHATLLTLGVQSRATIDAFDSHFWRFDLDGAATVEVRSGGAEVDAVGALLDGNGDEVATDDDGGTGLNFRIVAELDAGPHYVAVSSSGSGGDYGVIARLMRDDHHGETPLASTRLVAGVRRAGRIVPEDDIDVFRLDIAEAAETRISASGPTDTKGRLDDSAGNTVAAAEYGGLGANFAMTEELSPGVYYLSVEADGRGAYSVGYTVPAPEPAGAPPEVAVEQLLGTWAVVDRDAFTMSFRLTRLLETEEGVIAVEDHFRDDPSVIGETGVWIGGLADDAPPSAGADYLLGFVGPETCAVYAYSMVSETESGPVYGLRGTTTDDYDCEITPQVVETRLFRAWPQGVGAASEPPPAAALARAMASFEEALR